MLVLNFFFEALSQLILSFSFTRAYQIICSKRFQLSASNLLLAVRIQKLTIFTTFLKSGSFKMHFSYFMAVQHFSDCYRDVPGSMKTDAFY